MPGPGTEYLVIVNDPQLRKGVRRQPSPTPQKGIRFDWIRQILLKLVPTKPVPQASEPQYARRAAPVFGALD
jgi:hypothetical protein